RVVLEALQALDELIADTRGELAVRPRPVDILRVGVELMLACGEALGRLGRQRRVNGGVVVPGATSCRRQGRAWPDGLPPPEQAGSTHRRGQHLLPQLLAAEAIPRPQIMIAGYYADHTR